MAPVVTLVKVVWASPLANAATRNATTRIECFLVIVFIVFVGSVEGVPSAPRPRLVLASAYCFAFAWYHGKGIATLQNFLQRSRTKFFGAAVDSSLCPVPQRTR